MEFFVIRNHRQLHDIKELLDNWRLPFRMAIQDMYPKRSIDLNDYLWGFVYTPIARHTGHTPEEVHEYYKRLFNFKWDFKYNGETKKYEMVLETGSTATLSGKDMWDYAMQIRADAELEMHLTLQLPNEVWVPELNFEYENTHETKRL